MNPLFRVHKLNKQGLDKANYIAQSFDELLMGLEGLYNPNSREHSIVKTKLEEACFFAKKALAVDPMNQEQL